MDGFKPKRKEASLLFLISYHWENFQISPSHSWNSQRLWIFNINSNTCYREWILLWIIPSFQEGFQDEIALLKLELYILVKHPFPQLLFIDYDLHHSSIHNIKWEKCDGGKLTPHTIYRCDKRSHFHIYVWWILQHLIWIYGRYVTLYSDRNNFSFLNILFRLLITTWVYFTP